MPDVTVPNHPLLRHKLTLLRNRTTPTAQFRQIAREISLLLAYEVTRDLPLEQFDIETPLEPMRGERLAGKKLCLVSILRAGNGILEGMLDLIPSARVGHIGLYRDPATLKPVEYYRKLPGDISGRLVILVDPMLATGNSAIAAADRLKQAGVTVMKFVCLLAAPEGLIPMCRSSRRRLTRRWTVTATSGPAWGMRGIGFTGRGRRGLSIRARTGYRNCVAVSAGT